MSASRMMYSTFESTHSLIDQGPTFPETIRTYSYSCSSSFRPLHILPSLPFRRPIACSHPKWSRFDCPAPEEKLSPNGMDGCGEEKKGKGRGEWARLLALALQAHHHHRSG